MKKLAIILGIILWWTVPVFAQDPTKIAVTTSDASRTIDGGVYLLRNDGPGMVMWECNATTVSSTNSGLLLDGGTARVPSGCTTLAYKTSSGSAELRYWTFAPAAGVGWSGGGGGGSAASPNVFTVGESSAYTTLNAAFTALASAYPSVSVAKDVGNSEGWVELGTHPLGQRFRSPNVSMTFVAGSAMLHRIGPVDGNLFMRIEASSGTTRSGTEIAAGCTSEAVNAENVSNVTGRASHPIFPFPDGCTLTANTLYWVSIYGDTDYTTDFTTGATGNNVSWWNNGGDYAPCGTWTSLDTSTEAAAGCDSAVESDTTTWTETSGDDMVFALGTPATIAIGPGNYYADAIAYIHSAFLSIRGAGIGQTNIFAQDNSTFLLKHFYHGSISDITFANTLGEDAGTLGVRVAIAMDANAAVTIHDIKVAPIRVGVQFTNASESFIRDAIISAYCNGIEMDMSGGDYASAHNLDIVMSTMSDTGTGSFATCGSSTIHGIYITSSGSAGTDGRVALRDVTITGDVWNDELLSDGIGLGSSGVKGNLDIYDSKVSMTQNVAMQSGVTQTGIDLQAAAVVANIVNTDIAVVNPNGAADTITRAINTGTSPLSIRRSTITTSLTGAGTENSIISNIAGATLTIRDTQWDATKYSDAGTTTEDFSPAYGSAAGDGGTTEVLTIPGVTTTHACSCSVSDASCAITAIVPTANTLTATCGSGVCSGDTLSCTCTKVP